MISVCIATYNGEKYIGEQIRSILPQIGPEDEIVISDDSSTDKTLMILKAFNDRRIRILTDNTFYQPAYNFENALKNAKGELLFLADQDDVWVEGKIKIMAHYLKTHDMVVSDCFVINERNERICDSFYKLRRSRKGFWRNIYQNTYLGCCMAFQRRLLKRALPFPKKIPTHDQWLGMMAEVYGKPYFCSQKLIHLRRHDQNFSPTGENSPYSFPVQLGFRAYLLGAVLKRALDINPLRRG